jgi:dienelactone hydrolase
MEAMDSARARAKLDAAIAALRERTVGGPVGGLGFSMGGFRVLLHLAERDEFDPPEVLEQFVAALRAAGTPVEARTWPGTGHASANPDVPLYAPTQAAEAWSITVRFLREHLGSP